MAQLSSFALIGMLIIGSILLAKIAAGHYTKKGNPDD